MQGEQECRYQDRFQHGTDDPQPTVRRERADYCVPIELHVDGADQKIKAAAELLDRG